MEERDRDCFIKIIVVEPWMGLRGRDSVQGSGLEAVGGAWEAML